MEAMVAQLDKSGKAIQEMFAGVAPRYDLLNHLLSGYLDVWWRRSAAKALDLAPGSVALDLCCGTGDQALALGRRGARVVAADFCAPMLPLAKRKFERAGDPRPHGLVGDTLKLPFAAGSFDAVTVSFGLRNVADLDRALSAISETLRPGGRVAFLEFAVPRPRLLRGAYLLYFRRVLPLIGKLLSPRGSAYSYLPESVLEFPQRDDFLRRMSHAGLDHPEWKDLTGGVVCLYTGVKR